MILNIHFHYTSKKKKQSFYLKQALEAKFSSQHLVVRSSQKFAWDDEIDGLGNQTVR